MILFILFIIVMLGCIITYSMSLELTKIVFKNVILLFETSKLYWNWVIRMLAIICWKYLRIKIACKMANTMKNINPKITIWTYISIIVISIVVHDSSNPFSLVGKKSFRRFNFLVIALKWKMIATENNFLVSTIFL